MADTDNIAVVERMFEAWDRLDWDGVAACFSEDGVLHSMYKDPLTGRPAIRARLDAITDGMESMTCEIVSIGLMGDTVVTERIDHFRFKGKAGAVPCAGIFEIEDGLIKAWREYCDSGTIRAILT